MENTGPYWNEEGHCYYVVDGQCIWAARGDGGSSTAGIIPSAASDFNSPSQRAPPPSTSQSWPRRGAPSDMKVKLATGYPTTRFGGEGSQGSGPALQASAHDPYREAMVPQQSSGPPPGSAFTQTYNIYKDLDDGAEAAEIQYKNYLKTAAKISNSMRSKAPGVYAGQPFESKKWHQTCAEYARRASDIYRAAADEREKMARDFPAYDTRRSAVGHVRRVKLLRSGEERMRQKYSSHYHSHDK